MIMYDTHTKHEYTSMIHDYSYIILYYIKYIITRILYIYAIYTITNSEYHKIS